MYVSLYLHLKVKLNVFQAVQCSVFMLIINQTKKWETYIHVSWKYKYCFVNIVSTEELQYKYMFKITVYAPAYILIYINVHLFDA